MSPSAPSLDHVSLQVADLGRALQQLEDRLGLTPTPTPQAHERHSRVFLHRGYLEVSTETGAVLRPGERGSMPWFFLRFEDLAGTLARLEENKVTCQVGMFEGLDGTWKELCIEAPASVPMPLLIHQPSSRGVMPWPPPLMTPQPCGAFALATVLLATPELVPALDLYQRMLGGTEAAPPWTDELLGGRRTELALPAGRIALIEPRGHGAVSAWLSARGPGIAGLLLAVADLRRTEGFFRRTGIAVEPGITPFGVELWVDPRETFGIPLGFVETSGATPPVMR